MCIRASFSNTCLNFIATIPIVTFWTYCVGQWRHSCAYIQYMALCTHLTKLKPQLVTGSSVVTITTVFTLKICHSNVCQGKYPCQCILILTNSCLPNFSHLTLIRHVQQEVITTYHWSQNGCVNRRMSSYNNTFFNVLVHTCGGCCSISFSAAWQWTSILYNREYGIPQSPILLICLAFRMPLLPLPPPPQPLTLASTSVRIASCLFRAISAPWTSWPPSNLSSTCKGMDGAQEHSVMMQFVGTKLSHSHSDLSVSIHIHMWPYCMNFLYIWRSSHKDTHLNTPIMQNTYWRHIIREMYHGKHELYYYVLRICSIMLVLLTVNVARFCGTTILKDVFSDFFQTLVNEYLS